MKHLKQLKLLVPAAGILLIAVWLFSGISSSDLPAIKAQDEQRLAKLPDFSHFTDVKEKKETFFNTLYPIVEHENLHILNVRQAVVTLQKLPVEQLSSEQISWLNELASHYRLDTVADPSTIDAQYFKALLTRVDYVPMGLVLTQAAIESGWGSSRFSKSGNNIFGQWCFTKGCGMVPKARDSDKTHEVAQFDSVNGAIRAYLHNLNTNSAYQDLRVARASIRQTDANLTGKALAKWLTKYSEEGQHYVTKLTDFIRQNKLQRFEQQFEQAFLEQSHELSGQD